MVLVLLSELVEGCFVSRMRDFYSIVFLHLNEHKSKHTLHRLASRFCQSKKIDNLTYGMWHVTCDMWWEGTCSQNFRSLVLLTPMKIHTSLKWQVLHLFNFGNLIIWTKKNFRKDELVIYLPIYWVTIVFMEEPRLE